MKWICSTNSQPTPCIRGGGDDDDGAPMLFANNYLDVGSLAEQAKKTIENDQVNAPIVTAIDERSLSCPS